MSRKKPKRRKPTRRFVSGPLTMEQYGTELFTRTDWDPDEFEKFRQRLKQQRPQLKTEITSKVRRIETIVQSYDPLHLLLAVSIENCIGSADEWPKGMSETNICYAEYAQSLILALDKLTFDQEPSKEVVNEFKSLIQSVFHDVQMYYGFEMAEDDADKDKGYLRFLAILKYLFVRGDSIPQHHSDLMRDLFSPHDFFFKTHYGFSASEILSAQAEIERQLEQDFNRYIELQTGAIEALHKFKDFVQSYEGGTSADPAEVLQAFLAIPEVSSRQRSLKHLHASIKEQPFSIEPNEALPADLLKLLSATFGDNRDFLTFQKAPRWPMNDSVVHSRPLIEHRGTYYCFVPQLLFHNIGRILEQWIQEKDISYFQTAYQDARGKYLETKSLEYLGKILPGAQIFRQLYYRVTEDGQEKRVEADGLILYDRNLIVIETKAASLHVAARRGGLTKMEKDCREILDRAYRQARRTLSYIRDTDEPRFEYKNGNEALVLKTKGDITDFWTINVSAENLGYLAAQLNSLRALGLMQGSEWPWSVFVNDLRVIADLIEFPSEFFHYVQKRTRLNEFPQFSSPDELEIFMYYLYKGLHFDEEKLLRLDRFLPTGFTKDLDRYYNYCLGIGTEATKPTLNISEPLKHFIMAIEGTGTPYRTRVVMALLSFNKPEQDDIIQKLVEFKDRCREKGEFDDFSVRNIPANAAMTFYFYPGQDAGRLQRMRRHSEILKYHYKLEEYTLFTVDVSKQDWTGLDLETFKYKWAYDSKLEEMVKSLRAERVHRVLQSQGKIGRNDPCPCGSGRKYKKCCGKAD